MKRISRIALMTMLSVLLLGGTRAFAGGDKNGQGQNNQGSNGGGLITWIDTILNDIFGGNNNSQGGNNNNQGGGNYDGSGWANGGSSGGGTAPIDGGIGLLLAAGVGLGIRKLARRS